MRGDGKTPAGALERECKCSIIWPAVPIVDGPGKQDRNANTSKGLRPTSSGKIIFALSRHQAFGGAHRRHSHGHTSPASAQTHESTSDDLAGMFWKWSSCPSC